MANAAVASPTASLSLGWLKIPPANFPFFSFTSTRIAVRSPTSPSTTRTSGAVSVASVPATFLSSSTSFGTRLAIRPIARFHAPGAVPNRDLTVSAPHTSLADAVSGRLYRNTSRFPHFFPKSTTLRCVAGRVTTRSPPSQHTTSSPQSMYEVARMVSPTPPEPAQKYEYSTYSTGTSSSSDASRFAAIMSAAMRLETPG